MRSSPRVGVAGRRLAACVVALAAVFTGLAAEKRFDLDADAVDRLPSGFRSALAGEGASPDWRVVEVPLETDGEVGSLREPVLRRERVVTQVSRDPTDERFPILIWEGERVGDFTWTARARVLEGMVAQMAGLVFRYQDERNFYVLRLSALGNTVRFYKVVDGVRSPPIGVDVPVSAGVWHELRVECRANQIRCWFNGRELFPALSDNSFTTGRIGLWTKSDSASQFKDLELLYRAEESLARRLVRQGMIDFSRLVGLELFAAEPGQEQVRLVASSDTVELGVPAGSIEAEVAKEGTIYYGKEKGVASVVLPVRDRNGDPVAALRVRMKSFTGQTRDNALARARPVADRFSAAIKAQRDLFE
jgi:hypothetical protein